MPDEGLWVEERIKVQPHAYLFASNADRQNLREGWKALLLMLCGIVQPNICPYFQMWSENHFKIFRPQFKCHEIIIGEWFECDSKVVQKRFGDKQKVIREQFANSSLRENGMKGSRASWGLTNPSRPVASRPTQGRAQPVGNLAIQEALHHANRLRALFREMDTWRVS